MEQNVKSALIKKAVTAGYEFEKQVIEHGYEKAASIAGDTMRRWGGHVNDFIGNPRAAFDSLNMNKGTIADMLKEVRKMAPGEARRYEFDAIKEMINKTKSARKGLALTAGGVGAVGLGGAALLGGKKGE